MKDSLPETHFKSALFASLAAGKAILEIYDTKEFGTEIKADQSPLTLADTKAHQVITNQLSQTGLPVLSEEGRQLPFEKRKDWDHFWLVDPLDGTKEFIKRNGEFTVNIALVQGQVPVFGIIYVPVTDVLYIGDVNRGAYKIHEASLQNYDEVPGHWPGQPLPCTSHNSYGVVASRSHLSEETKTFINQIKASHHNVRMISRGSSLKICMVAEGEADIYPRFGPTSEWDTAAGHAIAMASGARVYAINTETNSQSFSTDPKELAQKHHEPLHYNKANLLNPWFIVQR